ncbi:MAG TPA: efflux RND transporter periplasmic adaptor subunit [Ignavibacteriales bacterium]|nr:efflux RND transporter periplasmic adaptor subunit [Ignavibacteriales bacterium]
MKLRQYVFIAVLLPLFAGCGNGEGENYIEESGTVEAVNVLISSKVAGTVDKILFEEGKKISAGDTIMIIDHESLDIQLKQAEARALMAKAQLDLLRNGARKEDIAQAKAALTQAEASMQMAKSDKERMENLIKNQSVSQKQYEDALTNFEIKDAQYKAALENYNKVQRFARPEELLQAEGNYEQAEAGAELIKKSIRDSYIKAPINGYIIENYVEVGETVSNLTSLVKLADLSSAEVIIYVSETDLGKVKLGRKAEIFTDSYPGKSYSGTVSYISPEAEFTPKNIQTKDERTKLVFKVKIKAANNEFELKSGMPADAKVYFN